MSDDANELARRADVDELQRQIAALKAEIGDLRRRLEQGEPRLGPRPETDEQFRERALRMAETVAAIREAHALQRGNAPASDAPPPPVDRSNTCTTSGEPVAKVRAEQTETTGQHKSYVILCDAERAKGYVRPYRDTYRHLTCGTTTTMGRPLAETYARDPTFYGSTFCAHCNAHYAVAQFVWYGTSEPVGS